MKALGWSSAAAAAPDDASASASAQSLAVSAGEELLSVMLDGSVLSFDLFGHFRDRKCSMGAEALQHLVADAKFFHSPYGTPPLIILLIHSFLPFLQSFL